MKKVNFKYYGISFETASSINDNTKKTIFSIIFSNPDVDDIFYYDINSEFQNNSKTIIVVKSFSNKEALNILQKEYSNGLEADNALIRLKEIYNNKI